MQKTLILADSLFWFGQAIRIAKESREQNEVHIGVSERFAAGAGEEQLAELEELFQYHFSHLPLPVVPVDLRLQVYDQILSLHCQTIFPVALVNSVPCINLHPGYLPHGRGWHPVTWARLTGEPAGATLHYMDEGVDTGPVIARHQVEVDYADTCADVHRKVRDAELTLLRGHEAAIVEGLLRPYTTEFRPQTGGGPARTRKQYEELCEIGMEEKMTAAELVSRLAALTYDGNKSNAILRDGRGNKIRVGVFMERLDEDEQ